MVKNYFLSKSGMDSINKEQLQLPQLIRALLDELYKLEGDEIIFTIGQYSSPPGNEIKYVFKQKTFSVAGSLFEVDSKFNRRLFVISYLNNDEAIIRFERKFDVSGRNQQDFSLDFSKIHAKIKELPTDVLKNGYHNDGPFKTRPHTLIDLRYFNTAEPETLLCRVVTEALGITQ